KGVATCIDSQHFYRHNAGYVCTSPYATRALVPTARSPRHGQDHLAARAAAAGPLVQPAARPGAAAADARSGIVPARGGCAGERSAAARIDLLEAYVETYLTQEIRAEALVRSLDSFARFLEVAALANAQVTSVASLARDAAVARPTVQGYFEVLADTLIGAWLPAWRPRAKV